MSIAPLEIYLLIKMVMCSILILPAVCPGFFLHKENVGARLKQLAHCPDKRQHSPTNANTNSRVSVRRQLVLVGECWRLSGIVGRVQHVTLYRSTFEHMLAIGHSHFVPLTLLVFEILICTPPAFTYCCMKKFWHPSEAA